MTHPRTLRRRVLATVTTAGLAASGLVALAAPTQAAETGQVVGGSAAWGLSTYLNTEAMGSPGPLASGYVAPASFDAGTKLSSFAVESADIESNGSAVIELDGASLNYAPTGNRWLKLDDLIVDIGADGNGEVSALVSYGPGIGSYPDTSYDPEVDPFRGPTRVTIVDLVGNTAAENSVTSSAYRYPSLDGTWSPDLITFLSGDATATPAIPALSYRSQLVNDDPAKKPQPLDITVARATPKITPSVGAPTAAGVTAQLSGDGFRGDTNPGDTGVYAAVAKSGGRPDVSALANQSGFITAAFVPTAQITDGAFTTNVDLPAAKLIAGTSYSVYTWQAHRNSNTSQDSETPLPIDWNAIATKVTPTVQLASVAYGSGGTGTVTVAGGTGTVTVGALGQSQTATLANGSASFAIPAGIPAGSYPLAVSYSGDYTHFPTTTAATLTVTKAGSKTVVAVKPKPTARKAGKATVTGQAGAKVAVVVKKGKKTVKKATVRLKANGKGVVKLPKAAKGGKFTVRAAYAGDANTKASTGKASYSVKKPKAKKPKKKR